MKVTVGSQDPKYSISEVFSFPFLSAFTIILPNRELLFFKSNRTQSFFISGTEDLKIAPENPSLTEVRHERHEDKLRVWVTVPSSVDQSFSRKILLIENVVSRQQERVFLTFHMDYTYKDYHEYRFPIPWTDILTLLVILAIFYLLFKCIFPTSSVFYYFNIQSDPGVQLHKQPMPVNTPARVNPFRGILSSNTHSIFLVLIILGQHRHPQPGITSTDGRMKNLAYRTSVLK